MGNPTGVLKLAVLDRTPIHELFVEGLGKLDAKITLRRARVTETEASMELEIQASTEEIERAKAVFSRPGLAIRSFTLQEGTAPLGRRIPPVAEGRRRDVVVRSNRASSAVCVG